MNADPTLTIIIPARNEAAALPTTLESIGSASVNATIECILVDAGSGDNTRAIAEAAGCRIIASDKLQRARQLNLGARHAHSKALLFLHADTRLPRDAVSRIMEHLETSGVAGGAFTRRFDSPSSILKVTCRLADWRSRWCGIFLGDQAIFVTREAFEKLKGFDETLSVAEDLDFSLRLKRIGNVVTIDEPVVSSARRFARIGPLKRSLLDFWFAAKFLAGWRPPPTSHA